MPVAISQRSAKSLELQISRREFSCLSQREHKPSRVLTLRPGRSLISTCTGGRWAAFLVVSGQQQALGTFTFDDPLPCVPPETVRQLISRGGSAPKRFNLRP